VPAKTNRLLIANSVNRISAFTIQCVLSAVFFMCIVQMYKMWYRVNSNRL